MIPGRRGFWGRDARMILGETYKIYTLSESLLPFPHPEHEQENKLQSEERRKTKGT